MDLDRRLYMLKNFPDTGANDPVEFETKNIVYRFKEGQTHVGMPRG
jgi:hypothetical protein